MSDNPDRGATMTRLGTRDTRSGRQEIRDIYSPKGFTGNLLDRVVDTIPRQPVELVNPCLPRRQRCKPAGMRDRSAEERGC
jgi:hypothetical protein